MSDTLFGGWIESSERAQSRRIEDLTDDLSYLRSSLGAQQATASALRSDLASLRGTIEARLARLAAAFDAFVELSSLRDQLALVAGPALVRQATRARLVALGTPPGDRGPLLDVAGAPPAPGYWLADALAALGGDDPDAADRAAVIDRRRTATFLTVAGAACDRPDLVARWVSDALGTLDPDRPVDRAQRAVWVAAAEGRLGDGARTALRTRLRAAVDRLPDATVTATVQRWTEQVRGTARTTRGTPGSVTTVAPQIGHVRRAVAALARLRTLATDTAVAAEDRPARTAPAGEATLDALVTVLQCLVDEGAEEERGLMHRIAELEAVVTGAPAPEPAWDAPAGDLLDLLHDDALGRTDAVGAVAREVCGPWLVTMADTYAREADLPGPEHVEGVAVGVRLLARPTGPVTGLTEALARARTPQDPHTTRGTTVLTGLAVAAGAAAAAALALPRLQGVLWVVAVVAAAAASSVAVRRAHRTRADAARAVREARFAEGEAARLQSLATQIDQILEGCRLDARDHHRTIVAAWGTRRVGGTAPAVEPTTASDAATEPGVTSPDASGATPGPMVATPAAGVPPYGTPPVTTDAAPA